MAAAGARPEQARDPAAAVRPPRREAASASSMSKRRGEFITLDDLIDEIGVDATRFFMLQRSHDTTIDLDLDLAREESAENPVYYVQYAHARIVSVLRKAGDERVAEALGEAGEALRARAGRARAGQEAARVPGRGRRGGRAPGAAPDRQLRARARADVHRVLPRLQGRRRRAAAASSRSGSACASRRGGPSRARSTCSASRRPTRCRSCPRSVAPSRCRRAPSERATASDASLAASMSNTKRVMPRRAACALQLADQQVAEAACPGARRRP